MFHCRDLVTDHPGPSFASQRSSFSVPSACEVAEWAAARTSCGCWMDLDGVRRHTTYDRYNYGYGSIRINTIFSGMNIHLPAILGFTRYQGFDPSPYIITCVQCSLTFRWNQQAIFIRIWQLLRIICTQKTSKAANICVLWGLPRSCRPPMKYVCSIVIGRTPAPQSNKVDSSSSSESKNN